MTKTFSLFLLASATSGSLAHAQPAGSARSPLRMDVAGVRLGMAFEQAQAALKAASYACTPFSKGLTFAQQVEEEVAKRRGERRRFRTNEGGPMQLNCKGPNQEHLRIDFAELRSGAVVDDFRLLVAQAVVNGASLRSQLAAKYGKPTMGDEQSGIWCEPGFRCNGAGVYSEGPAISINTQFGLDIMATRGGRARKADEADVMAAADAIAPKKTKAAF